LVVSRLHDFPRYRQRLAWIPVESHPVWVDDADFNPHYHIRHTALPAPGSVRQLKRLAGRIVSQQLDRGKPLWEMWVVEGVEGGRFAVIAKVHHCMIDGISGVDLIAALLRPEPSGTVMPAPVWEPRPAPSGTSLLARDLARRVSAPFSLLADSARDPAGAARELLSGAGAVGELLSVGFQPASETPFNPTSIGPHRRFDWVRFDLGAVRETAHAFGGTVNDVVLTCVAGATRAFLAGRGVRGLRDLEFRVMVPVSTRASHERGRLGNRVAQIVVPLPVAEKDPIRRLRAVIRASGKTKRSGQARGGELIESLGDWITPALVTQAVRLQARTRPYNLVVTNVPGPPIPLYLLDAPLLDIYPVVPLFKNQALGVALFGYHEGLYWGFNSDWDRLPDLHDYVGALAASWDDLAKAAATA
ncbi:MAG TPA: wax ester/triacylglycerol synthase family O-acyltransferase, partial [Myxococcota bacterium]|nr:wax ester/triacylglycerol synthase family O-acyltransferase [Myxococcota bacterium]